MIFHWSLSDSKPPQISRTLLSILAVLNNAVVWMVSTCPPISKSSSPFNNPLVTVPKAPITIGTIVTFMFHSFFQFPSKVHIHILLFTFSLFYSVVSRDSMVQNFANSLFLLIIINSGPFTCVILSDSCRFVHIQFIHMVKFKFLAHFPVDHLAHPVLVV